MQNGGTVVDGAKEKEYQAVIDELHKEIDSLKSRCDFYQTALIEQNKIVAKLEAELSKYHEAVFNYVFNRGKENAH